MVGLGCLIDVFQETVKGNPESVYQMMNTHGDTDSLLFFANMLRDYDTVVNLHIQQENHDEALAVLVAQVCTFRVVFVNLREEWIR